METGRDEYITFLLKALAGGRGRAFPNCSWLEQEALVRHVWAEVILDVSHTPAGQLVLGQVKAKAAQLENCGLGFRSLQEAQYTLWWSVSSRLWRLLINSVLTTASAKRLTCKCCLSMKRNTDWFGLFMTIPALSLRPRACTHCFS